jgi:hypothetical protein
LASYWNIVVPPLVPWSLGQHGQLDSGKLSYLLNLDLDSSQQPICNLGELGFELPKKLA